MRIHYVAAYMAEFPSDKANSIHVMRMCEAFSSLGHDVVLYVRDTSCTSNEIFSFYGIPVSFEIVRLSSRVPRLNRAWHCLKAVWLARRAKCDFLISRSAIAASLGAMAKMLVVFDAHGPIWQRNVLEQWGYRYLLTTPYLFRMTANSAALKSMYEKKGLVPKVGITVANNGATSNSADQNVELRGGLGKLQVGYTGHLYKGRGIETICELARLHPDVEFHVVGGKDSDVLVWKERAPYENLHFYGFVTPSRVASYIRSFDVLLAPYQEKGVSVAGGSGDTSEFMNPVKVMEYMVSGRAIIASDLAAIREVLPEDAALFAGASNLDEWSFAIEMLKEDSLRNKLGAACLAASKDVSWVARAQKMIGPSEAQQRKDYKYAIRR